MIDYEIKDFPENNRLIEVLRSIDISLARIADHQVETYFHSLLHNALKHGVDDKDIVSMVRQALEEIHS